MIPALALAVLTVHDVAGAVELAGVDFSSSLPARDTAIAQNTRLLAFGNRFDDNAGVDNGDVRFRRVDNAGDVIAELDVTVLDGAGPFQVAYLVDLGDLGLAEGVTVTCSACFDAWTGVVEAEPDVTPPVFVEGTKNRIGVTDLGNDGWLVRACLPKPVDESAAGVALVVVTDEAAQHEPAVQGGCTSEEVEATAHALGAPRRFCFQTKAIDAAGNEALFDDDVCVDLPEHAEGSGCASTSLPSSMVALVSLLAALWRRRMCTTTARGESLAGAA